MKVFKYLVALADISVGFLGLFFVIFAVARPTISSNVTERSRLQETIDKLRQDVRILEEIKLTKAGAGKKFSADRAGKITITGHELIVQLSGATRRLNSIAEFSSAAARWRWPESVVLYVDHRVPFEQVVHVIDVLKRAPHRLHNEGWKRDGAGNDIAVQIAALAK